MEKVAGYICFKNYKKNLISFYLKQMSDWCLMKNYDCTIYFDKVKSRSDLDRKELDRLKEDIKNKKYSKVVIKDITNVSRNIIFNLELLEFLENNNCKIESMDGIDLNLYKTIHKKFNNEEEMVR